jgi:dTDP-4-dehydrorhamnose 3,5-epimerase-like enzyme
LNSIKKYQIEPILSDERGLFFEVLNKIDVRHVIVTTFSKNAVRGNQIRKNMDQYFFLTTGKLKLILLDPENSNDSHEIEMIQGTMVFIPRGYAFVSKAIENSILLELSPQHFDPENPDIQKHIIPI